MTSEGCVPGELFGRSDLPRGTTTMNIRRGAAWLQVSLSRRTSLQGYRGHGVPVVPRPHSHFEAFVSAFALSAFSFVHQHLLFPWPCDNYGRQGKPSFRQSRQHTRESRDNEKSTRDMGRPEPKSATASPRARPDSERECTSSLTTRAPYD